MTTDMETLSNFPDNVGIQIHFYHHKCKDRNYLYYKVNVETKHFALSKHIGSITDTTLSYTPMLKPSDRLHTASKGIFQCTEPNFPYKMWY